MEVEIGGNGRAIGSASADCGWPAIATAGAFAVACGGSESAFAGAFVACTRRHAIPSLPACEYAVSNNAQGLGFSAFKASLHFAIFKGLRVAQLAREGFKV